MVFAGAQDSGAETENSSVTEAEDLQLLAAHANHTVTLADEELEGTGDGWQVTRRGRQRVIAVSAHMVQPIRSLVPMEKKSQFRQSAIRMQMVSTAPDVLAVATLSVASHLHLSAFAWRTHRGGDKRKHNSMSPNADARGKRRANSCTASVKRRRMKTNQDCCA